jgi:tetratricopeptide (TPR) repeat protein
MKIFGISKLTAGAALALLLSLTAVTTASAQRGDLRVCQQKNDNVDRRIAACTRIIDSRQSSDLRGNALMNRAVAYSLQSSDFGRAIADIDSAILLNPRLPSYHQIRGNFFLQKGDNDGAIGSYSEAIRLDPKTNGSLLFRGVAYHNKGEYDRAIVDFNDSIRLDPNNLALAHIDRGRSYYQKDDRDRALADFTEAIRIKPQEPAGYELRGFTFFNNRDYEKALRDFGDAVQRGSQTALALRGETYRRRGETDRAIGDLNDAIRVNPKYLYSYRYRSLARFGKNDLDGALADAARLTELARTPTTSLAPGSVSDLEAIVTLGDVLRQEQQFSESADVYSRGISTLRDPDKQHWLIFYNRGICYEKTQRWERAEADFKKALELSPDEPRVLNYLGYSWIERGIDIKEGSRLVSRAAELLPNDAHIIDSVGYAHYLSGNYDEAVRNFEKAVQLDGSVAEIHDHLGDAYWRTGRRGDAVVQWAKAKALKLDPAKLARLEDKLRVGLPDLASPAVLAAPGPVPAKVADAAVNPGRRVALIIGNSAYRAVAALPNPRRDAEAIATTLRGVGFQVVRLENDLPRDRLVDALRTFARDAATADWALVYFAGHGLEVNGINFLVPVDAKLETDRDVQYEAVALDQVLGSVEGAKKLRLVILDACRDNPFIRQMKRTVASRSIGRGLATVEPEGGTLVAYAAKNGEVALDGDGTNSPFVSALIRHLPAPGVEINKLFRLVRDDVMAKTNRKQEPFTYGSLPGEDFFFVAGQ